MAWMVWLAVPIAATCLAAAWVWLRGRHVTRAQHLDTDAAIAAHRDYLDALVIPARSPARRTPDQVLNLDG